MIKVNTNDIQEYEIEHYNILRKIAPECMVLLKKNGDFPICNVCEIALYGSGARETIKGGTGSGDVNVRHFVTIEEGLEKAGFKITTKTWLDSFSKAREDAKSEFYSGLMKEAKETGKSMFLLGMGRVPKEPNYEFPIDGEGDVCLYVLSRNSGEGTDREEDDIYLSKEEIRDILICQQKYKKFMLVLNVGGPVDISPIEDKVENILLLSQLGSAIGDSFADVLLGKSYPSGKLTTTWAKVEDYKLLDSFGEIDDTYYKEGIFVGYRYYDAKNIKPIYPFGFGLTYTEFKNNILDFSVVDNVVLITIEVENIGNYLGKETLMLYYSAPINTLIKPVKELGNYVKSKELKPKEKQIINIELPIENMSSWSVDENSWVMDNGDYLITINGIEAGIIRINEDVITCKGACAGGGVNLKDCIFEINRSDYKELKVIEISGNELKDIGHYDRNRKINEKLLLPDLSNLTNEELAMCCTGKHSDAEGLAAIIGSSASRVAGGAGETCDLIYEHEYGSMVMADGPAGIRICSKYFETEQGAESLDGGAIGNIMNLLPEEYQNVIKMRIVQNEEKSKSSEVLYHYASAIPIGTALAQSFNIEAIEKCGDLVAEEMERFGINVWLAPAMNIHRSPRCGRNFEYYSEDPIVAGKSASAITNGVQKHGKCIVTIKHFCCNNQETNRYGSNSIVSQRALREIYLKGFEYCVKQSSPKSLMTSYNLLNGIHTANREDLLTDILRNEWGFDGVVMTDWGTTSDKFNVGKYKGSSATLCIKAGNDLIMSGTNTDVKDILEGINNKEITRDELILCASRVFALTKSIS